MEKYETGAVRDTGGKGRMDLIPWCAIRRISKHMEDALTHYPERNWEQGLPMHTMIDSAFRHLSKYADGWTDEDHLCAAATNLLMAMWMEENKPSMQDIPTRKKTTDEFPRTYVTEIKQCKYYDRAQLVCRAFGDCRECAHNGDESECDIPSRS